MQPRCPSFNLGNVSFTLLYKYTILQQLNRRMSIGEEMQHRFAIKETRSKLKGTIGSRLMNERKKEKSILAVEHDHIMQITAPAMLSIMEAKDCSHHQ